MQIKEECFLEDINNVLQSGEVPNLYGKDEIGQLLDGVRKTAKKAGVDETTEALWAFFVDRRVAGVRVENSTKIVENIAYV